MNPDEHEVDPVDPAEAAVLEAEQRALDIATLKAQVSYLSGRVAELAKANAKPCECVSEVLA